MMVFRGCAESCDVDLFGREAHARAWMPTRRTIRDWRVLASRDARVPRQPQVWAEVGGKRMATIENEARRKIPSARPVRLYLAIRMMAMQISKVETKMMSGVGNCAAHVACWSSSFFGNAMDEILERPAIDQRIARARIRMRSIKRVMGCLSVFWR